MKQLPMTNGGFSLVDDDVFEWAQHSGWFKTPSRDKRTYYAVRNTKQANGSFKKERLHRLVLGLKLGDRREADHKDGNGMNNTRGNLRIANRVQNTQNRGAFAFNSTGYRCVTKRGSHFRVIFTYNKNHYRLGHYGDKHEAAFAFNVAANHFDTEFIRRNVIADEHLPSPARAKEIAEAVMCIISGGQRLEAQVDSATGYRGVTTAPRNKGRFVARICIGKRGKKHKNVSVGQYGTAYEAAYAYNIAAAILWPTKITTNKIPPGAIPDDECKQIEFRVRKKLDECSRMQLSS